MDEAQYWTWAQHLDWGYFSKPPGIAALIAASTSMFGDGMLGYAKGAPYAAIIAAAGGDAVPPAWIDQLAVGGRIVAPLQGAGGRQSLVVIDKLTHGVQQTVLESVHFVPLKSGIA